VAVAVESIQVPWGDGSSNPSSTHASHSADLERRSWWLYHGFGPRKGTSPSLLHRDVLAMLHTLPQAVNRLFERRAPAIAALGRMRRFPPVQYGYSRCGSNSVVAATLTRSPPWVRERYGPAGTKRQISSPSSSIAKCIIAIGIDPARDVYVVGSAPVFRRHGHPRRRCGVGLAIDLGDLILPIPDAKSRLIRAGGTADAGGADYQRAGCLVGARGRARDAEARLKIRTAPMGRFRRFQIGTGFQCECDARSPIAE